MSQYSIIAQNQTKSTTFFNAKQLESTERKALAIEVLSRADTISNLSRKNGVSRKFLYKQADIAQKAVEDAFEEETDDSKVLFYLPVTKSWLHQFSIVLPLVCHSSTRATKEAARILLDTNISTGSVHNIARSAASKAKEINAKEDLSAITVGSQDEIFQGEKPVLVGVDAKTSYCYLLSLEQARDGDTWGLRLLELEEKGFKPDYTIADGAKGIRAGQKEVWPEVPCFGDVFHALRDLGSLVIYLENRAAGTISTHEKLHKKMERARKKLRGNTLSKRLGSARSAENIAISVADDIAILAKWMQEDILCVIGPDLQTRKELFDFVVDEIKKREHLAPHRIQPVRKKLENQRDDLLAFASLLDKRLDRVAMDYKISPQLVRQIFELQSIPEADIRRWNREMQLRKILGERFKLVQIAVCQIIKDTVRASSLVENLNSILRNYFFLRRELGPEYLDLLRFYLNHRTFMRSHVPERVGRSPKEMLTGQNHPHWLEMLGFKLFKKSA